MKWFGRKESPGVGSGDPRAGDGDLVFRGQAFVHRWSQDGQHEFTPPEQGDLGAWTDMITINAYPDVHDGDALTAAANAVVGNYGTRGFVIGTDSVAATADRPAGHFVGAVFGQPPVVEFAFTRFALLAGEGRAVTYSHRTTRDGSAAWLEANGDDVRDALMSWSIPST